MPDAVPNRYDQLAYPSYTHSQTHPDQMAVKAMLFNMTPAPVDRCRVLELGCGDGTNLASFALALPGSEFVGIDLATTPIARGQEMLRGLELRNVMLRAMDVMESMGDLGQFDYIIAHGLYSWVPEPVRERILAVCSELLTPQGVAYVSYNTSPGGHLKAMLRDMMLFHTRGFEDPMERVDQSVALLRFIANSGTKAETYAQFLEEEIDKLAERDPANIFHDELGEVNVPVAFHAFCGAARRNGLQFLSEADYTHPQDSGFAPHVQNLLKQLGANRVAREQYHDFLTFRRFRQTLLCRVEVPLRFGMNPDRVDGFRISFAGQPAADEVTIESDAPLLFTGPKNSSVEVRSPLGKAALVALSKVWPAAVPFPQVVAEARAALGRGNDGASTDTDSLRLFELFLRTYAPGLTTLHHCPPRFAPEPGNRPVANPLARWLARTQPKVPSLCHTAVIVEDPASQHLLTLLDGTRDRDALFTAMRAFSRERNGDAEAGPGVGDDEIRRRIEADLVQFARKALLVP